MKVYAGIGSRETPSNILRMMTEIATNLEKDGWLLSSGGAKGADSAFEEGVKDPRNKRIFIAKDWENNRSTEEVSVYSYLSQPTHIRKQCWEKVAKIHPNPGALKEYASLLHCRNVLQIMGQDLSSPVKFVLYWAPQDKTGIPVGGTRTAVVLANQLGIPTFNMLHGDVVERLRRRFYV